MERSWTKDQRKAIELSGRNILVSAAAGSGKTAVLVERIIKKITDKKSPVDIDKLVVVTFTNAAAAEMKQRIRDALNELVINGDCDERIISQLTLINNAQITTIDSFCLNIVRNHYSDINLDPVFRTADEGEMNLLKKDVMSKLMEDYYNDATSSFLDFIDAYGKGRNDSLVEEMILKLYSFSRSFPWPDEWLDFCRNKYKFVNYEEFLQCEVIQLIFSEIKVRLNKYDKLYTKMERVCELSDGPSTYLPVIKEDHSLIKLLLEENDFERFTKYVRASSFSNLSTKKSNSTQENKAFVKDNRDDFKHYIDKDVKLIIYKDAFSMYEDIVINGSAIDTLVELTKAFGQRMIQAKRDRNIIDFNDMEHLALDILVNRTDGESKLTNTAQNLRNEYAEILIDEYQDSNRLQEAILTALSKGEIDKSLNNMYMVGDVKQSIYRFRLACPELFMDKYKNYTREDSPCTKIELQENFRSRENVLECVNDVFKRTMTEAFCGIQYDESARLNAGFNYPKLTKEESNIGNIFSLEENRDAIFTGSTDIYIYNTVKNDSEDESEEDLSGDMSNIDEAEAAKEEYTRQEKEAIVIAQIIKRLHDGQNVKALANDEVKPTLIFDKNIKGGYRPIRYSDIVILTRTNTGWSDVFVNTLMSRGIPAYSDSQTGYFNVREIKLIISFLTIIDNPLQDIPMAAVLLSYFGRFDTKDLARLRILAGRKYLYSCLTELLTDSFKENEYYSEELRKKAEEVISLIEKYRIKAQLLSVHDLLWEILYNTGYYNYIGTMPAGSRRQANLDMLLEKASAFEKTSYHGLFNFLRYIERIKKNNVDYGEASVLSENEDLVRIMSIHKSKGLEFPVVILAAMGKDINTQDLKQEMVIDQSYGIGTNVYDLKNRLKSTTIVKEAIKNIIKRDSISEELRILYVAMTRAREKLIMVGNSDKNQETQLEKWKTTAAQFKENNMSEFDYDYIFNCKNYFDIVMPVVLLKGGYNKGLFNIMYITDTDKVYQDSVIDKQNKDAKENTIETDILKDNSMETPIETTETTETTKDIQTEEKQVNIAPYPYEQDKQIKTKITVSELKKMQHEPDFDNTDMVCDEMRDTFERLESENKTYEIPKFILGEQKSLLGNERGTAYHRIMECLDYNCVASMESLESSLKQMVSDEKLTQLQLDSVDIKDIYDFCLSDIGKRVTRCALDGNIRREQPFIFTLTPDASQLIQGVIDLYILEDNEYTIIDYKTDRVQKNAAGRKELVDRYSIQLDYYARALSQLTNKKVKEKIIYSFTLGEAIVL